MLLSALFEFAGRYAATYFGLAFDDNPGVAFGLLGGSPAFATALSGCAFAVLFFLVFFRDDVNTTCSPSIRCPACRFALSIMAGGAAANFASRVISGAVPDWIPLPLSKNFFPPKGLFFNLADVEIALGAAAAFYACSVSRLRGGRETVKPDTEQSNT